MRRWLGPIPLFCLLCACDVASVREAPSTITHNECQSNTDCGFAGVCDGFQCRSISPTFQTVRFEVTPPDDGSSIAGVQFQLNKDLGSEDPSLSLGLISEVVGKVKAEALTCHPKFLDQGVLVLTDNDSTSVPALISLVPTASALGLYSPSAVVQSGIVDKSYWGYSVNVPPGNYDIYVQPNRQQDETCPLPPLLLRGSKILKGKVPLDIKLPAPSVFEFHLSWPPADAKFNGWAVDMLDRTSGRVISNRVPLARGVGGDYVASISYNPVLVVDDPTAEPADQLLRISPPDDLPEEQAAPTVLLARSGLGLFTADRGTLTAFTSLPSAVLVHGQVTAGDTPKPAAATVTLVATKITGLDPGLLASFVRTVSVGSDGQFELHLLPGTYRVSTIPLSSLLPGRGNEDPLGADTQEWLVPSAPSEQAGKVIALGRALAISGAVVDASDSPVASAQVQAVASPLSIQSDILQQFLAGSYVPRASAGGVSSKGDFNVLTDPGTFDFSVRPDPDTGFAWLVMPNLLVSSTSNGVGLGRIGMPLPFPYGGTVTVDGAEGPKLIPGALIRAYIYLRQGQYTTDVVNADSVLQVAETRANDRGVFEILIPAELNRFP